MLLNIQYKRSFNFKMSFWCLQFSQKNEQKQLRYHSSKVKFFHSIFGRIEDTKKDISKLTDLYYGSNKSTGKETGKTHLCALRCFCLLEFLYGCCTTLLLPAVVQLMHTAL